jgi:hypothetical protein
MNRQFERMIDQVLKYKPPPKGKKAEKIEAEKKTKKAKPKKND